MKLYIVADDDIITELHYHDYKIFLTEDQAHTYFNSLEWNHCTDIHELEVEPEPITPIIFAPSEYKCSICSTHYPGSFDLVFRANKYITEYFCGTCLKVTLITKEV